MVATRCGDRERPGTSDDGFTIVEMMVVVLVLGILIAVALPTYLGARDRARDRAAQADLRNGLSAATVYNADQIGFLGFDAAEAETIEPSLDWIDAGVPSGREVLIQVHSATAVLLVRHSESGSYFCLAETNVSPITYRGHGAAFTDVDTVAECNTGW